MKIRAWYSRDDVTGILQPELHQCPPSQAPCPVLKWLPSFLALNSPSVPVAAPVHHSVPRPTSSQQPARMCESSSELGGHIAGNKLPWPRGWKEISMQAQYSTSRSGGHRAMRKHPQAIPIKAFKPSQQASGCRASGGGNRQLPRSGCRCVGRTRQALCGTDLLPVLRGLCDVELRQHQPDVLAVVLPYPAHGHHVASHGHAPCKCLVSSVSTPNALDGVQGPAPLPDPGAARAFPRHIRVPKMKNINLCSRDLVSKWHLKSTHWQVC